MSVKLHKSLVTRLIAGGYVLAFAVLAINAVVSVRNLEAVRTTWDTLVADGDFLRV